MHQCVWSSEQSESRDTENSGQRNCSDEGEGFDSIKACIIPFGHSKQSVCHPCGTADGASRAAVVFARADLRMVRGHRERIAPVLVVAGYLHRADDFDAGMPDFVRFLQLLEVDRPAPPAGTETAFP